MTLRTIALRTRVDPIPGSGILRPFPSSEIAHLDPFVFLDTGSPLHLGDRDIYVGPHPHRGVAPVSLLFRGHIEHRASLGSHATVTSGGMQWLVSGSGALHEEVLRGDADGVFHMAQLWVNVPNAHKMDPPEHHAVDADAVPLFRDPDGEASIRLYAGQWAGHAGPAPSFMPMLVALVTLGPGGKVVVPAPRTWTAAATVVDGHLNDADPPGTTLRFAADGDAFELSSANGGQVLVMAGQPIGEPIFSSGGFVTTSQLALDQAHEDALAGRLGTLSPSR